MEEDSLLQAAPPREFVCPLSLELLKDPVAVVETGEVYERSAIEGWFQRGNRVDPWTRQPLSSTRLTPVRLLRRLVEEWVEQQSTRERLGAAGSGGDDDSSVPLIAPERLRLGRELGQGGMGRVVAASLLPLNQPVAVKMVQMQALTANDSARFRREVRVLARASLCCNNVCRLLGVAQKDGALCIVMPLYEESLEQLIGRTKGRAGANGGSSNPAGPSVGSASGTILGSHSSSLAQSNHQATRAGLSQLEALLRVDGVPGVGPGASAREGGGSPSTYGGLPLLQALQIAQDVALAMVELHRQHIIVQDLKPANVLLERNGRAVVADFGISVMHASTMAVHRPTSTQGTPNYMAPEQWDPDRGGGVTSKADVWAFGCLLLEMLTGEPPWKDLSMGQMCMQVGTRKASPPIPRNLPPALSTLLSSCFNPEPMRRPAFPPILDELRQIWALARPREDGQGGATSPQAGQGDPDASTTARRLQEELDAVRAELAAAVAAGEAARAALESERQQREGAAREAAGREQGYQREVERLREQGVVAAAALERARGEGEQLRQAVEAQTEALERATRRIMELEHKNERLANLAGSYSQSQILGGIEDDGPTGHVGWNVRQSYGEADALNGLGTEARRRTDGTLVLASARGSPGRPQGQLAGGINVPVQGPLVELDGIDPMLPTRVSPPGSSSSPAAATGSPDKFGVEPGAKAQTPTGRTKAPKTFSFKSRLWSRRQMWGSYSKEELEKDAEATLVPSVTAELVLNDACVATLTAHTGVVWALLLTGDGRLVSGAADNSIKVWDLTSYRLLFTFPRLDDAVHTLAVSKDGRQISSAGVDSGILVWGIADRVCRKRLVGHRRSVSALAVTPDGHLVSASCDRTIKVWQMEPLKGIWETRKHDNAWTALAVGAAGQIYSGCDHGQIKLWTIGKKVCDAKFRAHFSGIDCLVFSGSGGHLFSGSVDHTIKVWATPEHTCVGVLSGHARAVYALTFDDDGIGYSASGDRTIKVWKIPESQRNRSRAARLSYT
eukprot:jgi/Mesvir1/11599/Mv00010-RA.1